jgi:hypothetical protein
MVQDLGYEMTCEVVIRGIAKTKRLKRGDSGYAKFEY